MGSRDDIKTHVDIDLLVDIEMGCGTDVGYRKKMVTSKRILHSGSSVQGKGDTISGLLGSEAS